MFNNKSLFLCLAIAHNFASDGAKVNLVLTSGRQLNLTISERKMHEARACVENPGDAFRGFLREQIPEALIESGYEGLIPNSLCMSIKEFDGTEDLKIPEDDDKPLMGRLVILSDICRRLDDYEKKSLGFVGENSDGEEIEKDTENIRIIPGIGAVEFNKSPGAEDLPLDELLAMELPIFKAGNTIHIGHNPRNYKNPVLNQQFAEFLRAIDKPLQKCDKKYDESISMGEYEIMSPMDLRLAIWIIYTGQDIKLAFRGKQDSIFPATLVAREILSGLSLAPYERQELA